MKTALIIIDMQQGSFTSDQNRHDVDGLIARINTLSSATRRTSGIVIFVKHNGKIDDAHHPSQPGYRLLPELDVFENDVIVTKTSCDSFLDTELETHLVNTSVDRLIITGCATDYCVDTTVRGALGRGYATIVPTDGHTTSDREHLDAISIINHHNAVWADFISPAGAATLMPCREITFEG